MSSAVELETGHYYVAVGTERFKKLPYVELLVSKAAERYCYARSSVSVRKDASVLAVLLSKTKNNDRQTSEKINKTFLCTLISHFLYMPVVFSYFVDITQERESC